MEEIILYTTETCSKCLLLKNILDSKNIKYTVIDDLDKVMEKSKELEIMELPILITIGEGIEIINSGSQAVIYGKEL